MRSRDHFPLHICYVHFTSKLFRLAFFVTVLRHAAIVFDFHSSCEDYFLRHHAWITDMKLFLWFCYLLCEMIEAIFWLAKTDILLPKADTAVMLYSWFDDMHNYISLALDPPPVTQCLPPTVTYSVLNFERRSLEILIEGQRSVVMLWTVDVKMIHTVNVFCLFSLKYCTLLFKIKI